MLRLFFGKHTGKTMEQVRDEDPNYLLWLADSHQSATVKDLARQLLGLAPAPVGPPSPIDGEMFVCDLPDATRREVLRRFHRLLWSRLDAPDDDRTANVALHALKDVLANLTHEAYVKEDKPKQQQQRRNRSKR